MDRTVLAEMARSTTDSVGNIGLAAPTEDTIRHVDLGMPVDSREATMVMGTCDQGVADPSEIPVYLDFAQKYNLNLGEEVKKDTWRRD